MFTAKKSLARARTGVLKSQTSEIATPNFIIGTTRGAVAHITPDHSPAIPVCSVHIEELYDSYGPVRACATQLPLRAQMLLTTCRSVNSRTTTNKPNTMDAMGIDTVQGSRLANISELCGFMADMNPDLCLVPYDIPAQSSGGRVGQNRVCKMEARSLRWLEIFNAKKMETKGNWMLVAHIPEELQIPEYLQTVDEICDAYCNYDGTNKLKLSIKKHSWPSVLQDIANGFDLISVPLAQYADEGKALQLTLECAEPVLDLTNPKYATDMTLLGATGHALAYIHHLLCAKEMTAQILLQLHNYAVVDKLFADVRVAIEDGTFSEKLDKFVKDQ